MGLDLIVYRRYTIKMDRTSDRLTEHEQLASRLKALGHPARLEILRVLAERGVCICGEVVEVLPLAQSTVSQHLKVLREAGFVRGEVEGPTSCYCLDHDVIKQFGSDVGELFAHLTATSRPQSRKEKRHA